MLRLLWNRLADLTMGPRCERHPDQRTGGIIGCELCWIEDTRAEAQERRKEQRLKRQRRVDEIAEGILEARRRAGGKL